MSPPDPFSLAAAALLRPSAFAALLRSGRSMQRWAVLSALLWVGCAAAFVWVVGRVGLAIDGRIILAGLGLGVLLALLLATMAAQLTSASGGVLENQIFWAVRCLLTTMPCATLLILGYGLRDPAGGDDLTLLLLTLAICGALSAGALVVALLRLRERAEAWAVRWLLAAGALVVAAELHWWAVLPPVARDLPVLFLASCAAGLLRPFSWLWQAPLSLGLALAARAGASVNTLRTLHPAALDELSLLPLPGLASTLAMACAADLDAGGDWLLDVATHPGQGHAARRALRIVMRRGRHVHPLLFWLSTSPEGAALLRRAAQERSPRADLVAAYAALSEVVSPDAWPGVIAQHRAAFAAAATLPGGTAMLALLDAGEQTLRADRWRRALRGLRDTPAPGDIGDDPIWAALAIVRDWANDPQPAFAVEQEQLVDVFLHELADLDGWPVDLIAAIAEHLRYLVRVEQQRGALLV